MTTLRQDKSVQMRLLALRHLAANKVGTNILQRIIHEANMESDPAVMQYALSLGSGAIDNF